MAASLLLTAKERGDRAQDVSPFLLSLFFVRKKKSKMVVNALMCSSASFLPIPRHHSQCLFSHPTLRKHRAAGFQASFCSWEMMVQLAMQVMHGHAAKGEGVGSASCGVHREGCTGLLYRTTVLSAVWEENRKCVLWGLAM